MLILSRKTEEIIVIDGRITIKVMRIDKDRVKLGIDAPKEMTVHREEVSDKIKRHNEIKPAPAHLDHLHHD